MSLPDIIKPMNGRRTQGTCRNDSTGKNQLVGPNALFICPLSHRLNQVAEKVAARISENFNEAAIVMVKHLYVPAISSVFGSSAPKNTTFSVFTVILRWITAGCQLAVLSQLC